jgi:hypothetical protein
VIRHFPITFLIPGTVFVHKIAGALSEQGKSLQEIVDAITPVIECTFIFAGFVVRSIYINA